MSDDDNTRAAETAASLLRYRELQASRRVAEKAAVKQRLIDLRKLMVEHGIAACHAHYSGSGDSGDMDSGAYDMLDGTKRAPTTGTHWRSDAGDQELERLSAVVTGQPYRAEKFNDATQTWEQGDTTRDVPIEELVVEIADYFLALTHGGWENNEGGYGEVTITDTKVSLDHNEYFTETTNFSHEWDEAADAPGDSNE